MPLERHESHLAAGGPSAFERRTMEMHPFDDLIITPLDWKPQASGLVATGALRSGPEAATG